MKPARPSSGSKSASMMRFCNQGRQKPNIRTYVSPIEHETFRFELPRYPAVGDFGKGRR
jgi:hypothetical protein